MSKATHNGTCQACGRQQAVNNKTGLLAKHGYTVDYGYFSGTCGGSDRKPLEAETDFNVATVAAVRHWADDQDSKAAGNIETVNVDTRIRTGRYQSKTVTTTHTKEDFVATYAEKLYGDHELANEMAARKFDKKVEDVRSALTRAAKSARADAAALDALRDKTFGNDLISRKAEDTTQRHSESFKADRNGGAMGKAYARARELKAEGIRSRVTGDARYAEITYRK